MQSEVIEATQAENARSSGPKPAEPPVVADDETLDGLSRPTMLAAERATDLDRAILNCGFLGPVVSSDVAVGHDWSTVHSAGIPYQVVEERRRVVNDVVEHAYLQDLSAQVWPGAVIQGRHLTEGDTAVIALPRAAGTVMISTDLVSGSPGQKSKKVSSPSAATVGQARVDLLNELNPTDSAGILSTNYIRANTLREAATKLGVDVRKGSFGVGLDASYDSTYQTSTVIATIRQMYYVASFEPDSGGRPSGVFDKSVSLEDLEPLMGPGNPPVMITHVQIGRMLCLTATAQSSAQELLAALRAHWDATVSGSITLDAKSRNLIDSAQVRVYAVGSVAPNLPGTLTNPVADLDRIYRSGLAFSLQNPGAPIGFTARHLAGGSLAHTALVAEYVQPVRASAADVRRSFPVWDGRGGGHVDTGIEVAPGDGVHITATGQAWSGVWGTGTHGPEGWPTWKAPTGAPAPNLNAHCLIGRFGSGPWFKIGAQWSGGNATGGTGRLQLNINDDNPYNGDAARRFTVTVEVRRRQAAAAGIYV